MSNSKTGTAGWIRRRGSTLEVDFVPADQMLKVLIG